MPQSVNGKNYTNTLNRKPKMFKEKLFNKIKYEIFIHF